MSLKCTLASILLSCALAGAAENPNAPPKPKTVDTPFLIAAGTTLGVGIWDVAQSQGCFRNVPGCVELNHVYGPHPGAAKQYSMSLAFDVGFIGAGYVIKRWAPKPLRRLWVLPMAFETQDHLRAIKNSYHGEPVR